MQGLLQAIYRYTDIVFCCFSHLKYVVTLHYVQLFFFHQTKMNYFMLYFHIIYYQTRIFYKLYLHTFLAD